LNIGITNIGYREAQVTSIGWKIGYFKKHYATQTLITNGISSKYPIRLKDGEEADYYIPLSGDPYWIESFVNDFLTKHPKILVHFIWIQVGTSIGKVFESKIEKSLRKKILEAALKNYKK
jgi:hypothetical protein